MSKFNFCLFFLFELLFLFLDFHLFLFLILHFYSRLKIQLHKLEVTNNFPGRLLKR